MNIMLATMKPTEATTIRKRQSYFGIVLYALTDQDLLSGIQYAAFISQSANYRQSSQRCVIRQRVDVLALPTPEYLVKRQH